MKPVQRRNIAIVSALSSDGAFPRHADEEQHLQSSDGVESDINRYANYNLVSLWCKQRSHI